jgi:hypothetical protein
MSQLSISVKEQNKNDILKINRYPGEDKYHRAYKRYQYILKMGFWSSSTITLPENRLILSPSLKTFQIKRGYVSG